MARAISAFLLLAIITIIEAQRPFYAGFRPIGYPAVESEIAQLSNRFGEDDPVPIETKGDRNFINRIESVPVDYRPFWYINWQQYNALRQQPQTWPQKPNNFID
ncbi:hypothetical protein ABMA28_005086 [Loxostege sticticalis]|uniref:Seminal fluid protein HACP044 n=1 Tax=Loxostege sticticalis TaxID=481309 RepID=A0ABD0SP99_LOXSC